VSNRPKVASFRSPHVPQSMFAIESVIDELATRIGMDPVEFRLRNVMRDGATTLFGEKYGVIGAEAVLESVKGSAHYNAPLPPGAGRGMAFGFWFTRGGETTGSVTIAPDGTVNVLIGVVDVAGSRLAMSMMVAEEFGIPLDRVRTVVADTTALGYNMSTVGSRSVFAGGMVVIDSARKAIAELVRRAAKTWNVPEEAVVFADGECRPAGANVGEFPPLTIAELAKGGAVAGHSELLVTGQGPGFGAQVVDVTVDKETGHVKILRHTVFADVGKVVHRMQLEGQFQGALAQGIGWALNEEYVYGSDGRLQNPSFLDYRMPVASDLVMLDTTFIEVPNPKHPFGARGAGETPLTPALAAIANAVTRVIGARPHELPMSPPRVLKLIEQAQQVA
jgi:CO/xanthine dehydrogenase Mo-binding subunit